MEISVISDFLQENYQVLVQDSVDDGYSFLQRLLDEYSNGKNRFDQKDEILLGMKDGEQLVGIGGLNQDPYNEGVIRLRHLYVMRQYRKKGRGKRLVEELLERTAAPILTLRVADQAGASFYERLGFKRNQTFLQTSHVFYKN
ncbi:GNAT family N-acetyltransferase [Listeria costaricensis]|uniref:GNAT family N-acetyltransferase n=1 Tax=Listeria costaricensis TaxID=2026604 RepID=UPI000C07C943|nr:GNAT family N-acetyltransferase [Listeria costaricensis]